MATRSAAMLKMSTGALFLAAVGVAISGLALVWLVVAPFPHDPLSRMGPIFAILAAAGLLAVSWGAGVTYFARRWDLSPRFCQMTGLLFPAIGALLLISHSSNGILAGLFACQSVPAGQICRWMAYGRMTNEEFDKWLADEKMKRWTTEFQTNLPKYRREF
jgi:hypothetical protein